MTEKQHYIKKIGIYDSGLGGLFVLAGLYKEFPNYQYVFIGDEKNLPYGSKDIETLFGYARDCLDFLFEKQKCDVVIIACNTLSATVYETLVLEYSKKFPDQLLIDIITPTITSLSEDSHFSVFGTERTVTSHIYKKLIQESFKTSSVDEFATIELASLIEKKLPVLEYLKSFKEKVLSTKHTCILACTHYGLVQKEFEQIYPKNSFVCQQKIMLDYMKFFLHPGPAQKNNLSIFITKDNPVFDLYAQEWFGNTIRVECIDL